jgi:hypothetical protein
VRLGIVCLHRLLAPTGLSSAILARRRRAALVQVSVNIQINTFLRSCPSVLAIAKDPSRWHRNECNVTVS